MCLDSSLTQLASLVGVFVTCECVSDLRVPNSEWSSVRSVGIKR